MPERWHACSTPGCAELTNRATPCPVHGRPADAPWTEGRDYKAQSWFRRLVMARSGGVCERCHRAPATVAHHVKPGYEAEAGLALCDECHRAIDEKARRTKRNTLRFP